MTRRSAPGGARYGLTPMQADAVRIIGELIDVLGRSPTMAEIAREMEISRSRAHFLVCQLRTRGWCAADAVLLTARLPVTPECEVVVTPAGLDAIAAAVRRAHV